MKKSFLRFTLLLFITCIIVSPKVFAYTLKAGKYPSNLSSNLHWYIDSSAKNMNFGTNIAKIVNWNKSPWPIAIGSSVDRDSMSQIRFYYEAKDMGETVAECTNFLSSTNVYSYSVITLYAGFKNASAANKNETIVHEVGHALGLGHEDVKYSIMKGRGFVGIESPTADDMAGLDAKY